MSGFFPEDQHDYTAGPSTAAISREDLLKEMLPGLNKLFGLEYEGYEESFEVGKLRAEIEKNDEKFMSKEVYLRVVHDYEKKITDLKDKNMDMIKKAAGLARKDGVSRAADLVESMAEEMGNSNLLHAVVLALRNMDVPE